MKWSKEKKISYLAMFSIIGFIIFWIVAVLSNDEGLEIANKAWSIRYQSAENPLKKFNQTIFKNIAFRGIVLEKNYDRKYDALDKVSVQPFMVHCRLGWPCIQPLPCAITNKKGLRFYQPSKERTLLRS